MFSTLITVAELDRLLSAQRCVVVDCRFDLADVDRGRRDYQQGHIPGARYAHLDQDLSGPLTDGSGRHPLPAPEALAATLGDWGIDRETQVVVYDASGGAVAARLWWLLRWLGHDGCALLDGGLPAWRDAGRPLSGEPPEIEAKVFHGDPDDALVATTAEVQSNIDRSRFVLIDARAAARFNGEHEPIDRIAGHVPGAINLPLTENLRDGRFLPPEALRKRFQNALSGAGSRPPVHSCGSGVTACHNALAMAIAGLDAGRVYIGSWSEWVQDADRPVATAHD